MTKIFLLVLLGALAAVSIADDGYVPPQPKPSPGPTTAPTEPTLPPTKPTTPAPTKPTTEPTKPPTEPTKPPTEPTKPPTQPTKPPTQPTKPPTKPTEPPTPPTKPTPAPTPAPTPEPPKPVDPDTGIWQVNYTNSNISCLLVQFALQIEVPYNTTNNKTFTAAVNIPENATSSGLCGNETQSITLEWSVATGISDKISLNFAKNSTSKKYKLIDVEVTIATDSNNFPGYNGSDVFALHHKFDEFTTSDDKSYRCAKKQELNLTDDASKVKGTVIVSHLQFQAFQNSTAKHFTASEDCAPADTPDVVPIAVGCALAALVIIVLIAYLIGRRRRQARGYLSMFTGTKRESDYIPMKNLSCFQ